MILQDSGSVVRRSTLANGLRVITEQIPSARSTVFGVWVCAGSRDEQTWQHGAAHYLEHLLFKATPRRSAFDVNAAIDAVGGEMNAFTSRETTCFYAHVRDADLPIAADVVLDVVTAGLMTEQDVESERQVVLEEIAMHEDDPGDVAMERFYQRVLADEALARPILGTTQSIEGLAAAQIRQFYADHYHPSSIVIAVAGAVQHDEAVRLVQHALGLTGWGSGTAVPPRIRPAVPHLVHRPGDSVVRRPTEQTHIVIGGPSMPRNDPDKYALAVFNAVLGGGMSSRLFHKVREEHGLAYSVYSFAAPFVDCGVFGVYAGTRPKNADEAIELIQSELVEVLAKGVGADEVARGVGSVRGSRILALEDPFSRMNRLGQAELLIGELLPIDEIQRRIEAVTVDDVMRVATRLLPGATTRSVVGPLPPEWTVPPAGGARPRAVLGTATP